LKIRSARGVARRAAFTTALVLATLGITPRATAAPTQPTSQPAATSQPSTQPSSEAGGNDLTGMSLEDLMNVQVTSVSRQKQRISETAAAVTVITQDDIERSGLTSVPELMRLVPGMDVARLNANTWAIGSRGFNEIYSNKLLVLDDGRSVYTPLFSGVFWDMEQPMLQDLDRIEVIRGPGATIWGSNAVNGVINITSKSARDTQGFLVDGLAGNYEQQGAVRFGGKIDGDTYFRVWGKYQRTDDFPLPNGDDYSGGDGWQAASTGFRVDHFNDDKDLLTLQSQYIGEREGQLLQNQTFTPPFRMLSQEESNNTGANILGRWTHTFSEKADLSLQLYYDYLDRTSQITPYQQHDAAIEFHNRFPWGERQEMIWGAEYRYISDHISPTRFVFAIPDRRQDYIASTFVQDDITVVPDRLHAIAGIKLEQNSYSGFEYQPSGRLLWTPTEKQTVWGAISRAVRTPSRWEQTVTIPSNPVSSPLAPLPVQALTQGSPTFESEELTAYELGYRVRPTKAFSIDTSAFYNHYDKLRSFNTGTPSLVTTPLPHLVVPAVTANNFTADTLGVEIAANWQVTERWRLSASYSYINIQAHHVGPSNPSDAVIEPLYEDGSPPNQAQLHSYLDIMKNLQLNASLYYVDTLRALGIPPYIRADVAVTWTPIKNLDLTAGVQNLFQDRHTEFGTANTTFATQTEVPRTFYGQLTFRY
jgi:iron complex outermembrane receptor protein